MNGAERQRLYRARRRDGVVCVTVEVPRRVIQKLRAHGLAADDAELAMIIAETFAEAVDQYVAESVTHNGGPDSACIVTTND